MLLLSQWVESKLASVSYICQIFNMLEIETEKYQKINSLKITIINPLHGNLSIFQEKQP